MLWQMWWEKTTNIHMDLAFACWDFGFHWVFPSDSDGNRKRMTHLYAPLRTHCEHSVSETNALADETKNGNENGNRNVKLATSHFVQMMDTKWKNTNNSHSEQKFKATHSKSQPVVWWDQPSVKKWQKVHESCFTWWQFPCPSYVFPFCHVKSGKKKN